MGPLSDILQSPMGDLVSFAYYPSTALGWAGNGLGPNWPDVHCKNNFFTSKSAALTTVLTHYYICKT